MFLLCFSDMSFFLVDVCFIALQNQSHFFYVSNFVFRLHGNIRRAYQVRVRHFALVTGYSHSPRIKFEYDAKNETTMDDV